MTETRDEEVQRLFRELNELNERFFQSNQALMEVLTGEDFSEVLKICSKVQRKKVFVKMKRLDELKALGKTQPGWYERGMKMLEEK